MPKPTVLITETLDDKCAAWLAAHADVIWCPHDSAELDEHLARADGLVVRTYTQVNAELLGRASSLKVVGRAGVGLDNIDLDACRQRNVRVVYTPDANTQAVVEYVLGLMLDDLRPRTHLPPGCDAERFHQLRKTEVGKQLDQRTLGIVGLGRIGKKLGEVTHAIGMNLLVCDLLPEAELRKAVDYPFDFVDHATLYTRSDIATLHVDGRLGNRHMLDAEMLAHLCNDVLLINTARGMLIDNTALADWAAAHPDARAVLDVHDPEPPSLEYPLFNLPNVRLLPHLASRTARALESMSWVVRDVVTVLEGREPKYPAG